MTTTNVKYFHNGMAGAPVLSGTAGAMIGLLDACLINGIGSGTVDSVAIASGIATVTRAAGHSFEVDTIALIAGATVSGGSINGEKRVLSVAGTTYTFDATGISDQTATGTITHKLAPLEWSKTYSGTNLAAYKPDDVAATGNMLRVDDTGTLEARVVGYLTMSDVNTGTGPFPTAAQVSGGAFWAKSSAASGTARAWTLVGDSRGFMLHVNPNTAIATVYFGDIANTKSPDPYACMLSGGSATYAASGTAGAADGTSITTNAVAAAWLCRSVTGLGGSVALLRVAPLNYWNSTGLIHSGATTLSMPYPNPADNGLYVTPYYISDANATLRGTKPGLYFCPQAVGVSALGHREKLTGITGLPGKVLMTFLGSAGVAFADITGPWTR